MYTLGIVPTPPPPPLTTSYDPPHRRLRRRVLCALLLRFEDLLRGSVSLEAVRVSGSGLLLQSWPL